MSPSLVLIGIYIVLTALLQFVGFLISQVVSTISPPLSLTGESGEEIMRR